MRVPAKDLTTKHIILYRGSSCRVEKVNPAGLLEGTHVWHDPDGTRHEKNEWTEIVCLVLDEVSPGIGRGARFQIWMDADQKVEIYEE